jgi:MFS family permease
LTGNVASNFWTVLRDNPNYRYTWMGQVVSEVGDHFNSIAVLSLAVHLTGTGVAAGGVMIARTMFAIVAGPIAGVALDRFDRKKIMIASDLVRAVIAIAFVLVLTHQQHWLLYVLSGLLMFASPFFTSGRSAILPRITSPEQLHTANALTQTTAWLTLAFGTLLGGVSTMQFGYEWAFVVNALSFVFSAWAISRLRSKEGHFRPDRASVAHKPHGVRAYWSDFADSVRYMRSTPLILAIALAYVGWATGGGAAQILFTLYGALVFKRGPAGIGIIWSAAGFGLVAGGFFAHWLGKRLGFAGYRHTISIAFFVHGASYILYAVMPTIALASLFVGISRVAMGCINVLNRTMLLTHVPDRYRGRVFSTAEMMMNATMMLSLALASVATRSVPIRTIGVVAGCLSASVAVFWAWADVAGKLREPPPDESEPEETFESPVTSA